MLHMNYARFQRIWSQIQLTRPRAPTRSAIFEVILMFPGKYIHMVLCITMYENSSYCAYCMPNCLTISELMAAWPAFAPWQLGQ